MNLYHVLQSRPVLTMSEGLPAYPRTNSVSCSWERNCKKMNHFASCCKSKPVTTRKANTHEWMASTTTKTQKRCEHARRSGENMYIKQRSSRHQLNVTSLLLKTYHIDWNAKPKGNPWVIADRWVTPRHILPEKAPELGKSL